jgi:hypothetical protein
MCASCLNKALTDRLEHLCAELLPGGHREGPLWRCGDLSGAPGGSMVVNLSGRRRGHWHDFNSADGERQHGDALDIVRRGDVAGCNGDLDRAVRWGCAWVGQPMQPLPAELRKRSRAPQTPEETRAYARKIWREARPLTRDTMAWRYLVETRCIVGLQTLGPLPALRYHPRLWNTQLRAELPALVAAIVDADHRKFAAVHRTFLMKRNGTVIKAPVPKVLGGPKRSLGEYAGGCIPLWPGKSGRPWRDPEPGEPVAISEGIEDGLTFAVNRPTRRVVAAVTVSNMRSMTLPAGIGDVYIAMQNDKPDGEAAKMLRRAIKHFRDDLRRRVFTMKPPAWVKDLNDLQRELVGREADAR